MAAPNVLGAHKFKVYVYDGAAYEYLCIATQKNFNRQVNFEEAYLPDCANEDAIPNRTSRQTGRSWDLDITAYLDPNSVSGELLRDAFDTDGTINIKITEDVSGGTSYTGAAWVENLSIAAAGAGLTNFTMKLRGEGALTKTPVA